MDNPGQMGRKFSAQSAPATDIAGAAGCGNYTDMACKRANKIPPPGLPCLEEAQRTGPYPVTLNVTETPCSEKA